MNVEIIKIGKKEGIKVIATNDAHYLSNKDVGAHDALLCILTGKLISDQKRLRYTGTEYIKDEKEMLGLFNDHIELDQIKEAVNNTNEISKKVEEFDLFGEYRMPKYPLIDNKKAINYLKEVSEAGLTNRLRKSNYEEFSDDYKNRLSI